ARGIGSRVHTLVCRQRLSKSEECPVVILLFQVNAPKHGVRATLKPWITVLLGQFESLLRIDASRRDLSATSLCTRGRDQQPSTSRRACTPSAIERGIEHRSVNGRRPTCGHHRIERQHCEGSIAAILGATVNRSEVVELESESTKRHALFRPTCE